MTTTRTSNWWPPVTLALSLIVGIVGLLGLMVGEAVTGGEGRPFVLVAFPVLGSMLMLGGLVARRSRPVGGSRLVVAGATLAVLGDLFLIPVPVVVILGGIWSGNLVLTDRADRPELRAVQGSIADRWPWWILAAAVFTALGFAALVVGDLIESESCTESSPCWEGTAVWATWILSWLAAMVTGAIGLVLGVLRAATRHHTRLA